MKHVYLIAEIGCNHNGDYELARRMVLEAKKCGVDAVKFQTFIAENLVSKHAKKADYQIGTTGVDGSQLSMLKELELPREEYLELSYLANEIGLDVFSTAFDLDSALWLANHGQTTWKIPSGEITNLPLLRMIGAYECENKRVIVSSGMATVDEIRHCLDALHSAGTSWRCITLLHCNTEYPTPDTDMNLSAISGLKKEFPSLSVGLSDHSLGSVAAVGAVALGATLVEKHFTLDKNMPGPDHKASALPYELAELCEGVRRMELMLGNGQKGVTRSERKNRNAARKSLVAKKPIKKGEVLCENNLSCKRPGNGISPMLWDEICGLEAERDFEQDELIVATGFEWQERER